MSKQLVNNKACQARGPILLVWKVRSMENEEYGECGVGKIRRFFWEGEEKNINRSDSPTFPVPDYKFSKSTGSLFLSFMLKISIR